MAKKTIKNPSGIQVINMKDEREELDFLKTRLPKSPTDLSQTDVNSATVPQLRQLFYIDDICIQKIVGFKEEGGVFYSQDEFFDFIDLKPHERVGLKPYVSAGEEKPANVGGRTKNRRIVDY